MSSGCYDSGQSAIIEALLNLLMPSSETDVNLSDYIICCTLISSLHVSVLSSKAILNKLVGHLLQRAFLFDQNSQESSGLWRVWGALHAHHPCPQQLELITINVLISTYAPDFRPRVFTSYEQLLQEPLLLFSLPYSGSKIWSVGTNQYVNCDKL